MTEATSVPAPEAQVPQSAAPDPTPTDGGEPSGLDRVLQHWAEHGHDPQGAEELKAAAAHPTNAPQEISAWRARWNSVVDRCAELTPLIDGLSDMGL